MGRPTKRTPERVKRILALLKSGNTRTCAANASGISKETFYEWLREFPDFADAVTRAESEAEAAHVATIKRAATVHKVVERRTTVSDKDGTTTIEVVRYEYDWRAAETWLKRRRRADWGDSIDVRKLDDDTLLRLLALEDGGAEAEADDEAAERAAAVDAPSE